MGYSIQQQLQSRLLWLLLLLVIMLLVPMHLSIRYFVSDVVESRLEHDAESLISALSRSANGDWRLDVDRLSSIYQRAQSGHYYRILSDDFTVDSRSLWDIQPQISKVPVGDMITDSIEWSNGEHLVVLSMGVEKSDAQFTVWVAEDVTALLYRQISFEIGFAILFILLFLLVIYLQRRTIRSGFNKLEPIRNALQSGDVAEGLKIPSIVPEEIKPLVKALESTLDRYSAQLKRSRVGLGNLAHELKRPIQKLQWLAQESNDLDTQIAIKTSTTELDRLMRRELKRARISGAPSPGSLFHPHEDLFHLTTLLKRMYPEEKELKLNVPDESLPFDRDDLLELLGSLLDNAYRHANKLVVLNIDFDPINHTWRFEVQDDGEGVSELDIERMMVRGVRLDEDQQLGQGTGLGLSISRAVVESYNGTMVFSKSELGGLFAHVQLPLQYNPVQE